MLIHVVGKGNLFALTDLFARERMMDQLWILVGTGLIDSHLASSINGEKNEGV